jgi:hypothetical protein
VNPNASIKNALPIKFGNGVFKYPFLSSGSIFQVLILYCLVINVISILLTNITLHLVIFFSLLTYFSSSLYNNILKSTLNTASLLIRDNSFI